AIPEHTPAISRRSGSRVIARGRVGLGLDAADSITAILADQSLRVRPLASSVAPTTPHATGASRAKLKLRTPCASSSTSTPTRITPRPATSGATCNLAPIGCLAAGVLLTAELEVAVVVFVEPAFVVVADGKPAHADVRVEHDARVAG